jgi:uncharacterized protein YjbJ (UPF0337 family)
VTCWTATANGVVSQAPSTGEMRASQDYGRWDRALSSALDWKSQFVGIGLNPTPMRGHSVSTVDKAKNKAQEAKGHVKEAAGKATKDQSLETEGKGDKVAGNLKQAGEKVKDAFKK